MLAVARWRWSPSGSQGVASVPARWATPIAPKSVGGCLATRRDGLSAIWSHRIQARTRGLGRTVLEGLDQRSDCFSLAPRNGRWSKALRYDAAAAHLEFASPGTPGAFSVLGGGASLSVSVWGRHSAFMRRVHTTKKTGTFNVSSRKYPNSRRTERNSWRSLDRHQRR